MTAMSPAAALKVQSREPSRTRPPANAIVWVPALALTTSPVRLTALPLRVNAPAPGRNVIPLNAWFAAKSLLLLVSPLPVSKTSGRVYFGSVPPQFAASVQLWGGPAPPPVQ